ncbi:MAG: hypothetical protein U1F41_01010 [Burkholderiales bacterium]
MRAILAAAFLGACGSKLPANVGMAVVLRPINTQRPQDFALSLKVGVTPQSVKTERRYRTDAGEVFYVSLRVERRLS